MRFIVYSVLDSKSKTMSFALLPQRATERNSLLDSPLSGKSRSSPSLNTDATRQDNNTNGRGGGGVGPTPRELSEVAALETHRQRGAKAVLSSALSALATIQIGALLSVGLAVWAWRDHTLKAVLASASAVSGVVPVWAVFAPLLVAHVVALLFHGKSLDRLRRFLFVPPASLRLMGRHAQHSFARSRREKYPFAILWVRSSLQFFALWLAFLLTEVLLWARVVVVDDDDDAAAVSTGEDSNGNKKSGGKGDNGAPISLSTALFPFLFLCALNVIHGSCCKGGSVLRSFCAFLVGLQIVFLSNYVDNNDNTVTSPSSSPPPSHFSWVVFGPAFFLLGVMVALLSLHLSLFYRHLHRLKRDQESLLLRNRSHNNHRHTNNNSDNHNLEGAYFTSSSSQPPSPSPSTSSSVTSTTTTTATAEEEGGFGGHDTTTNTNSCRPTWIFVMTSNLRLLFFQTLDGAAVTTKTVDKPQAIVAWCYLIGLLLIGNFLRLSCVLVVSLQTSSSSFSSFSITDSNSNSGMMTAEAEAASSSMMMMMGWMLVSVIGGLGLCFLGLFTAARRTSLVELVNYAGDEQPLPLRQDPYTSDWLVPGLEEESSSSSSVSHEDDDDGNGDDDSRRRHHNNNNPEMLQKEQERHDHEAALAIVSLCVCKCFHPNSSNLHALSSRHGEKKEDNDDGSGDDLTSSCCCAPSSSSSLETSTSNSTSSSAENFNNNAGVNGGAAYGAVGRDNESSSSSPYSPPSLSSFEPSCVLAVKIFLGGIRSFVNAFTTTTTVDDDADEYDESTPRSTTMMVFGSCLCCFLKCVSCFPVWWSFDKRSEALRGAPLLGPHSSLLSYHATEAAIRVAASQALRESAATAVDHAPSFRLPLSIRV